jgi:hypothetical protein
MTKLLKASLTLVFVLSLLLGGKALATDIIPITTDTASAAITAVTNDVTDTPDNLIESTVTEPTSIPTNWGLFWQSVKENIAVTFTFDPIKRAEKRIAYAEARIKQANYILENSTDTKEQEKAQNILEKANKMIEKAQEKKDFFENNPDATKKQLLENIAKLEVNSQRIINKMEDKASTDELTKVDELKAKIDERQQKFLDAFLANPNIPQDVKDRMTALKAEIAAKQKERLDQKVATKDLLEKAKAGDEKAKEDLKKAKEVEIEKEKKDIEALKTKKDEIIQIVKEGNISALKNIQGISSEVSKKLEDEAQELEDEKEDDEKAAEVEKEATQKELEITTEAQKEADELKKETETKKVEVQSKTVETKTTEKED